MKKTGFILILVLFAWLGSVAQPQGPGEKIRAIKKEFITEKIGLTPAQAEKFWPVYGRYEQEVRAVRREFTQKYPQQHKARDERESRRFIDDNIEFREERLKVEKRYKNEFLKVISARQLAELYEAEREFKKMLIENLKQRRGDAPGKRGAPRGR